MPRIKTYDDSQVDFSGGIVEQRSPSAFSERSLAVARGFVFENDQTLRAQPACQRVSTRSDLIAVRPFIGSMRKYLIAITQNGHLVATYAPAGTSTQTDFNSEPLEWWRIEGTENVNFRNYHFILDNDYTNITDSDSSEKVNALILSNPSPGAPGVKVFERYGDLGVRIFTDTYPVDTLVDDTTTASTNKFPSAAVGAILGARLFLGNTLYNRDHSQPFSSSNTQPYGSGIWYSEADTDTFFGLAYLFAGSVNSEIRGMHVLDNRLILITTPGTESDGVITIYGDFSGPAEAASQGEVQASITKKVIRSGVGAVRTASIHHQNFSTVWPDTGTVVFIDHLGGVWSTEGSTVDRIDDPGPTAPRGAQEGDHVAALGKHLFVWRDYRLLVLSVLGSGGEDGGAATAAWTELVTPGGTVSSMVPLDQSMYFLNDGQLWRYNFGTLAGPSEHGLVAGAPVSLTIGTRTHGDPGRHSRKTWLRFGVRARQGSWGAGARLEDIMFVPGPALDIDDLPSLQVFPSNPDIEGRYQAFVQAGIGTSIEASAILTFTGDVVLEEYSWTVSGVEPSD